MSNALSQAFTYALADYVTEYKLLPKLYNSSGHVYHRYGSLEPPPSPRSANTVKFANETSRFHSHSFLHSSLVLLLKLSFSIAMYQRHEHLLQTQDRQRQQFNHDA